MPALTFICLLLTVFVTAAFMAVSIAGTSAAAVILKRISDERFKGISRYLIAVIGTYCVGHGVYLLLAQ